MPESSINFAFNELKSFESITSDKDSSSVFDSSSCSDGYWTGSGIGSGCVVSNLSKILSTIEFLMDDY